MPQSSALPTYSALYAFGDSLSDAGDLSILTTPTGTTRPVSPPYYSQKYGPVSGSVFSNGPTWVQDVSTALGLGTLAPSLAGGTDYAYGGALTGATPQNTDPAILAISLPTQLAQFKAQASKPSANALYTVSIGANDLLGILANTGLSAQQQSADVNAAVANEVSFVQQLVGSGAKTLLVLNVPDLGKIPDVTSRQPQAGTAPTAIETEATQLSTAYNAALSTQLAAVASASGTRIQIVDSNTLLNAAIANPAAYGLTNATTPVYTGDNGSFNSGGLAASGAAAQDQYLFFDSIHPTETGHGAIADLAEQQLSGVPVLAAVNTTTGQPVAAQGQPYTGPVGILQRQYINITPDKLNVTVSTPNWFIHSGAGQDAIAVSGGSNVVDGGTGSNFLTGGSGTDSFFVDERGATATTWSTVANFHAGDSATLWGVSQAGFQINYIDGAGAAGATGLTVIAQAAGKPEALLTLAGFTRADLAGRLGVSFGTDTASGSAYMYIHANT
jgi:phospholipase/lecithinase/hemolysin